MYFLRMEHGYTPERFIGQRTVTKTTEHGKIIIDYGSRERQDRFEGRANVLDFGILDGNTVVKDVSGLKVPVPSRALLLLLKLKATQDREYRLRAGTSDDLEYEKAKLVKDYADVLALVDPEKGGHEIDVALLGEMFQEFPFLREQLETAMESRDGITKYGTTPEKARKAIGTLLNLL